MLALLRNKAVALLRFSERYTKTDVSYLARNGGWLVAAQVVMGLIALSVSAAFAHYLTKDAYGTYRFLLSLFWTFTAFTLSGIPAALTRAIAQGDLSTYRHAFRLSLLGGIPMGLVSLGASAYYFMQDNALLGYGCLIIALIGPLMQAAYLYGAFFEGMRDFRKNAIFGIILNLVPALVMLALLFYTDNPLAFLGANLGLSVVVGLSLSFLFIPRTARKKAPSPQGFFALSGHFSAMNILSTISQQADKIVVFHFLGAAPLAVYAFAVAFPDQIRSMLGNIEALAFPRFAKRPLGEIARTLPWRLAGLTALIMLGVALYILIAPFLFGILFPKYPEAVFYSQLYALALIPVGNFIPISALQAHARNRELYLFNIISPLFQIGVLTFGVISYGLLGAVIARIIGRSFSFLLSIVLFVVAARETKDA